MRVRVRVRPKRRASESCTPGPLVSVLRTAVKTIWYVAPAAAGGGGRGGEEGAMA